MTTTKTPKRPERKEIGSNRISYADRHKLKARNLDTENYVYRFVNTDDNKWSGRVEEMQQRGYTICNGEESTGDQDGTGANQVGSTIGKSVGNGTRAVLMRIPKEFYQEDQAAKQAEVDDTERGMVDDELKDSPDLYGEGLKVEDGRGTRLEVKQRK